MDRTVEPQRSSNGLRIAITADPEIPVPPRLYGGIERIIDTLVRGLVQKGHRVCLLAHPDSAVSCSLHPYPGRRSRSGSDLVRNLWHVNSTLSRHEPDLVHSFGRLAYLVPWLPRRIPKLMSYQRAVSRRSVGWGESLAGSTLHFSGCSRHLIAPYSDRSNWHVVYNGVALESYRFQSDVPSDAPLVFLGRVEEIKGVHLALEVARESGRHLIIAGNVPPQRQHQHYFRDRIEPHLDGRRIRYLGPVDDRDKNELLGQAAALLMPILWEEPFGIVMAEALACGTPVIGLNRGSVPEIVENGVNGFVCNSVKEMIEAVGRMRSIERAVCRRIAEERFSDAAMVGAYERLYCLLTGRS